MEQPCPEETPSLQPHARFIRIAAKALANKNIPVVEYGQQIQWRHGEPVVLLSSRWTLLTSESQLVEWAVPDALLSLSSQILSDCGIPCVAPLNNVIGRYGQWERVAIIHKLNERSPIYLYPLSLVGFALRDTVKVTSTFDPTLWILTPKPRMYMQSLICHLLDHPVGDRFRLRVQADLVSFISFYVLGDKPLDTKNGECDDDESEEDFQKRVDNAVRRMKSWDWGADENNYLRIAESVVRNCRSIYQLSNC
ncbi:hypothetical protein IFM46972_08068 [Aspergillus udagawae]|uniref:Uncharacterized protein n=1 Tax=Aspergillus udagawae TaxID=91492 RepID=A0A8H3S1Z4_9EURO|nr:hypothetical protein IFM46972_08068 [Aspergillus udagawae]